MITTRLKTVAILAIVAGTAAFMVRQQWQIRHLMADGAALREQIEQAASLRDENQRLAARLKDSTEGSQANKEELMRLRAQSSRLSQIERENAQLKDDRQRLASEMAQAGQATALSEERQKIVSPKVMVLASPISLPNETDFGVVEFLDQIPTRLELGAGKTCIVRPTALEVGTIQLDMSVEAMDTAGKAVVLGRAQVTTNPGRQCSVSVGDTMISLTPKLKTQ